MQTVSFIGTGRLGSTLARALDGAELAVTRVASRGPSAAALAKDLRACEA